MSDIPRLPDLQALFMPLVGIAGVVWALVITKRGRDRERETVRSHQCDSVGVGKYYQP